MTKQDCKFCIYAFVIMAFCSYFLAWFTMQEWLYKMGNIEALIGIIAFCLYYYRVYQEHRIKEMRLK